MEGWCGVAMVVGYETEYEMWCEVLDRGTMLETRSLYNFEVVISCSARNGTCGTTFEFMLEI